MMKRLILRGFLLIGERARTRKNGAGKANGAQGRNRTTDTAIFSRMLYQLSYLGVSKGPRKKRRTIERAVYSGPKRRCLPRFAFGFARARPHDGEGEARPA
jgi:hypothetical protein